MATNNLDGSSVRYYNQSLTNAEISTRFIEAVPNSLAVYLGTETGYFVARGSANEAQSALLGSIDINSIVGSNIQFDNDYDAVSYSEPELTLGVLTSATSDPDAVYGGATVQGNPVSLANSYFQCPASGRYALSSGCQFLWNPANNVISFNLKLVAWVTDNLGVFQYYVEIASVIASAGINTIAGTAYLNLSSGQRVYVYRYYNLQRNAPSQTSYIQFYSGRFFACTSVGTGGGVYQTYDPTAIPIYNYEFDYPVVEDDFNSIRSAVAGKITFKRDEGRQRSGWIDSMKYNHLTNQAKFIIASKDR